MYLADLQDLLLPALIFLGPAILHSLTSKKRKEAKKEAARERAASRLAQAEGRKQDTGRARPGRQSVPDQQPVQQTPKSEKPDWAWKSAEQSPPPVAKDQAEAAQELPAWLSKLAEDLGGSKVREALEGRKTSTDIESSEVSPIGLEETDQDSGLTDVDPWDLGQQAEQPLEGDAQADVTPTRVAQYDSWRTVSDADSSAYELSPRLSRSAAKRRRRGRLHGSTRSNWRQAILLREILGQPRALKDWREVETAAER